MVQRSIQASPEGIKQARQAYVRQGWTQEDLASEVGLKTRQSIGRFLAGKPVERRVFIELCFRLNLNWQDIAAQPKGAAPEQILKDQDDSFDIDALVEKVRSQCRDKIQDQCGTLHLLDIARPVGIDNIYIDVNILEQITSQRWLEISDLLQGFNPDADNFDRLGLGKMPQARVAGLEAVARYSKLMVLGKPGSGKTTFLKYIAIQCIQGECQAYRIPIFIRLKNFAEDTRDEGAVNLLDYISQELGICGVSATVVETLLHHGRALILLDGLDEVQQQDSDQVLKQIRRCSEKYYKNQFVITCRIAAQPYRFPGFTEVEVADFNSEEIEYFAKKWFVGVAQNPKEEGLTKASQFLEKLQLPENQQIRELAGIPLLLNLACLVFHFLADFPSQRAKFFEEGLDILLARWDETRGIQRDEDYQSLCVACKIKLLSQIAAITFEQGDYFFEQSKIQQLIANYLRILPDAEAAPEVLRWDSEAVLKAIEAQHGLLVERARGIYSFSHLTFQEYLVAREVIGGHPQALNNVVGHITEKRWRGVFLLTIGMLQPADSLLRLMKQYIDAIAASDEKLQQFLSWVNQKSLSVESPYKPAVVRAFYFALVLVCYLTLDRARALAWDLAVTSAFPLEPELQRLLQQLQAQLPDSYKDTEKFHAWWQSNGQAWIEQLRAVRIDDRQLGQDWQFTDQQKQALEQYYDANKLLVDCLNSDCHVTPAAREEISETLLVPARHSGSGSCHR